MTFSVTHVDGSMEQPGDASVFPALLDELEGATAEHGDVAVGHETGWTLTVLTSGRVVWENVEEDDEVQATPEAGGAARTVRRDVAGAATIVPPSPHCLVRLTGRRRPRGTCS